MKIQFLTSCIVLAQPCVAGEVREIPDHVGRTLIENGHGRYVSADAPLSQSVQIAPDPGIAEREIREAELRIKKPGRRAVTNRDA